MFAEIQIDAQIWLTGNSEIRFWIEVYKWVSSMYATSIFFFRFYVFFSSQVSPSCSASDAALSV